MVSIRNIAIFFFSVFTVIHSYAQSDTTGPIGYTGIEAGYGPTTLFKPDTSFHIQSGGSITFLIGKRWPNSFGFQIPLSISEYKFYTDHFMYPDYRPPGSAGGYNIYVIHYSNCYATHAMYFINFPILFEKRWDTKKNSGFYMCIGPEYQFYFVDIGRISGGGYPIDKYYRKTYRSASSHIAVQLASGVDLPFNERRVIRFGVTTELSISHNDYFFATRAFASFPIHMVSAQEKDKKRKNQLSNKNAKHEIYHDPEDSLRPPFSSIYFEALGPGGLGSINFEHYIFRNMKKNFMMNGRIGIGYIDNPAFIVSINSLYGDSKLKAESGLGVDLGYGNLYFHLDLGLRYRFNKGFMIRATYTPLIERYNFIQWGGLSLGYSW